jgi:hypothetical protein
MYAPSKLLIKEARIKNAEKVKKEVERRKAYEGKRKI